MKKFFLKKKNGKNGKNEIFGASVIVDIYWLFLLSISKNYLYLDRNIKRISFLQIEVFYYYFLIALYGISFFYY